MKTYYKLPISAEKIIKGEKAVIVSLEESIHQMISLLCTTSYKEYMYDDKFGSVIWEMDFNNIFNVHLVKQELKLALTESIELYEKRASLKSIQININQYDFNSKGLKTKIKLLLELKLKIYLTDKLIEHREEFFIGPLSYL
jgi:phage baseplate assembly protein W